MVVAKYLNSSTLSKELLSIFILWLRPAFWSPDMTMYLETLAWRSLQSTCQRVSLYSRECNFTYDQYLRPYPQGFQESHQCSTGMPVDLSQYRISPKLDEKCTRYRQQFVSAPHTLRLSLLPIFINPQNYRY